MREMHELSFSQKMTSDIIFTMLIPFIVIHVLFVLIVFFTCICCHFCLAINIMADVLGMKVNHKSTGE